MDHLIALCVPHGLDDLIRRSGIGQAAPEITDEIRRLYIVAILAAVVNGLEAPATADALVHLNGGYILGQERPH